MKIKKNINVLLHFMREKNHLRIFYKGKSLFNLNVTNALKNIAKSKSGITYFFILKYLLPFHMNIQVINLVFEVNGK